MSEDVRLALAVGDDRQPGFEPHIHPAGDVDRLERVHLHGDAKRLQLHAPAPEALRMLVEELAEMGCYFGLLLMQTRLFIALGAPSGADAD